VDEALSNLEVRISELEAEIEVGELPPIEADSLQMRQLFQNLIGNALKFHRPGVSPRIQVSAESAGEDACRIIVRDNGIGFEPKFQDRIFNVFQRLHTQSEFKGSGIGLAICKKIAERHGGRISAESVKGKGSIFAVVLPLRHDGVEEP
jgi:light-regulated signal transduction histidine kinase (bacteriophytochrome)